MAVRNENKTENRHRLMEIMEVVRRHEITRGITPEKLCSIVEDLGPTFIKLGQILSMRSDILPKEYCQALTKLRSQVAPMPYEQVAFMHRDPITLTNQLEAFTDFFRAHADAAA